MADFLNTTALTPIEPILEQKEAEKPIRLNRRNRTRARHDARRSLAKLRQDIKVLPLLNFWRNMFPVAR